MTLTALAGRLRQIEMILQESSNPFPHMANELERVIEEDDAAIDAAKAQPVGAET